MCELISSGPGAPIPPPNEFETSLSDRGEFMRWSDESDRAAEEEKSPFLAR